MNRALLSASLIAFASCSNISTESRDVSSLDSVKIPQSSVKDQGRVGFCWAYATMAFIESETLRRTGRELDLSEEYLGMVRIAAELAQDLRANNSVGYITQKIYGQGYEGWYVRVPDAYDSEITDAMELVDQFGVLEEKEFQVKFSLPQFPYAADATLNADYRMRLAEIVPTLDARSSDDEVLRAVAESFGATTVPKGHKITIKSKDYVDVWPADGRAALTSLRLIKSVLATGTSVPIGYGVSFNKLMGDKWVGGKGIADIMLMNKYTAGYEFAADGGHAVLVTDFVNVRGREGAISAGALSSAVAASPETLDYLVFKNSWSTDGGANPAGYYRLDLSYIIGTAQAGAFDFVVPRQSVSSGQMSQISTITPRG